jgi:ADP-ribose pyrophosphatase
MTTTRGGWLVLEDSVYESFPIFTLKKSRRLNPRTQQAIDFVRIEGLDWANIIPLTANNEVVLIRQYRHGSEEFTIEIPGGCVDAGEEPQDSAMRELREETGYMADNCELLGAVRPNPALLANRCSLYLARGVTLQSCQKLDAGEDIKVFTTPLKEVFAQVRSGVISHALIVAAFGLLALRYPELAG